MSCGRDSGGSTPVRLHIAREYYGRYLSRTMMGYTRVQWSVPLSYNGK